MGVMTGDDAALVRRAAAGDENSFELLVRRHTDSVWRLCYGILRDHGMAEDAVQESFVKAYRALPEFRAESSFKTWLLTIAHRTCLDQVRRPREQVVSLETARLERARETDHATRVALQIAIEALPGDEREAFMLVDVLGLSREEAASITGIPASTLKSRLARAHDRLIEAIEGTGWRARKK